MNFRQLFENKTPVTDYDTWRDKVDAQGGEIHPQRDRNRLVAQGWDGETIGEFHMGTNQGYINQQSIAEGQSNFAKAMDNLHGWYQDDSSNPNVEVFKFDDREGGHYAQGTVYHIVKTGRIQIEFEDRDGYHGGDVTDAFNSIGDAMNVLKNITTQIRPNTGKAQDFDKLGGRTVAGPDDLYKTDRAGKKGTLNKSRMDTMKASSPYRKTGPEGQLPEQDVDEGLKGKIAGAALAAANLLGSPAQAAEEPVKPITIAYVQIDGEVRKYNLGDKFSNAKEAEQFISGVLDKQGISGYTLDIKHGYPKQKTDEAGQGVAEGLAPNKRARLDNLIDQYRTATDPEAYYGLDGEYGDPDEIIAQIRQEFGDNVATKVDAGANKMHFGREHRSFSNDPYDWKKSPRVTRSGKINKQDSDTMKRSIKSNLGVAEGAEDLDRQALDIADKLITDKNLAKLNDMAHDSTIYRALERYFAKNNISTTIFNRVAAIVFKKLDKYGRRLSTDPRIQEQGMAETTGDPKFDKMLKGITGKRQVAKQQKADTKQRARDAFGGMFGGGNPADSLGIRKKGVAEENKGLYYNVNKRKKAGTSRDADSPKAPTAQAWKDAAKTAKKEDVAEGFDELDAYIKAKQAPKPSGGAGIKRGSYGMPGRKITKGMPGARPGGGSTGHTTPGNRDFGRPHSIPRATPRGIDDYDANYRREVDEGEYKDTVDKSKIPAVQRKAQGGDWKVSTQDLEHERSKSPTGAAGLAKAKQRLDMNENLRQLPPEVIDLLKKVAQSDAAPEHKKAIINSIMAKYQPVKDIAETPTRTAREKFNQGLKRAGFDPEAAAKRLTDLIAKQKAERDQFEKANPAVYGDDKEVKEEKVRLDPKCWTGKKIGNPKTKVKGGVRVNNCVPK